MKLFVMRHAQASFSAPSDRARPITDMGKEQTERLLASCKQELAQVNVIWCSDLLRAKQTAALVSASLNVPVTEKTFITPDGDVNEVLAELNTLPSDACLLMVSHQPLVGELVSYLSNANIHEAHPYTTSEILALELTFYEPGMARIVKQYLPS